MGLTPCIFEDDKNGTVQARNMKNRQKAIFLDRDGTINKYVRFLRTLDQFKLTDDAVETIKLIIHTKDIKVR